MVLIAGCGIVKITTRNARIGWLQDKEFKTPCGTVVQEDTTGVVIQWGGR